MFGLSDRAHLYLEGHASYFFYASNRLAIKIFQRKDKYPIEEKMAPKTSNHMLYQIGTMMFIRISIRIAVLGK